jgi:hypothetical protein
MIEFAIGFVSGVVTIILLSCMGISSKESRREEQDYTIIKCNENTILEQNTSEDCKNGQ